jgi:hypothetical protein
MNGLENGMLVKHASLGVGKVVALEPNAVHVFFPDADKRFAAKLRLPFAMSLLRTEDVAPNTWLEGLSGFTLDEKTGRFALAASWLTQDEAIAAFLAVYPEGFADPSYLLAADTKGARAACWRAAHEAWVESFGNGEGDRLLAAGDLKGLVKRALAVEDCVSTVHPLADRGAVKAAFTEPESTLEFFTALLEVLQVPSAGRGRFEKLFAAAEKLPLEPAQQWLVATLFPFVASPDRHVLLRPKPAGDAADRLGCDLRDTSTPNWASYAALRALATRLLEALTPNGAKDFVDVEGFLHVTAAKRPKAVAVTTEGGVAAPRKARAGAREKRTQADSRSTP